MIDKELQDHVWKYCLPKEFKEEVKKLYADALDASNSPHEPDDRKWGNYRVALLEKLFGIHNLTSDAEGEEVLTCNKGVVQALHLESLKYAPNLERWKGVKWTLDHLFGSKCLPDEVGNEDNFASKEPRNCRFFVNGKCKHPVVCAGCDISSSEDTEYKPKPAEPKFKMGDKVKDISSPHDDGVYIVDDIKKSSDGFIYHIQGLIGVSNVKESDLEPYTEPQPATERSNLNKESSTCTDDCSCQDHFVVNNEMVDRIIKDSFSKERRLNIAAMAMLGLLANTALYEHKVKEWLRCESNDNPIQFIPMLALKYADALIKKSEKGDPDGK